MSTCDPIFVVDSGIGGLSILRPLFTLAPDESYLYLADQAYFPYGDKDPHWVADRTKTLVAYAITQHSSAVVIACNTATVHSLTQLRGQFDIPIFGVEPVIKPLSQFRSAALLATGSTTAANQTRKLQARYPESHLKLISVPGLAAAIEAMDQAKIIALLVGLNSQLQGVEAIGLSCTHYPLVSHLITQVYPTLQIIDPSTSVAHHVVESLAKHSSNPTPQVLFRTTGDVLRLNEQISHYLGLTVTAQKVTL